MEYVSFQSSNVPPFHDIISNPELSAALGALAAQYIRHSQGLTTLTQANHVVRSLAVQEAQASVRYTLLRAGYSGTPNSLLGRGNIFNNARSYGR